MWQGTCCLSTQYCGSVPLCPPSSSSLSLLCRRRPCFWLSRGRLRWESKVNFYFRAVGVIIYLIITTAFLKEEGCSVRELSFIVVTALEPLWIPTLIHRLNNVKEFDWNFNPVGDQLVWYKVQVPPDCVGHCHKVLCYQLWKAVSRENRLK